MIFLKNEFLKWQGRAKGAPHPGSALGPATWGSGPDYDYDSSQIMIVHVLARMNSVCEAIDKYKIKTIGINRSRRIIHLFNVSLRYPRHRRHPSPPHPRPPHPPLHSV